MNIFQVSRSGIKEELTTRDDYLDNKFQGLSSSGHDVTKMTVEDKLKWKEKYGSANRPWLDQDNDRTVFLGFDQRGLYIAATGGLPVFASGTRLDYISNLNQIAFSEPCDPDHIFVDEKGFVYCVRSSERLGSFVSVDGIEDYYSIDPCAVHFLPLDTKWPVESQPGKLHSE